MCECAAVLLSRVLLLTSLTGTVAAMAAIELCRPFGQRDSVRQWESGEDEGRYAIGMRDVGWILDVVEVVRRVKLFFANLGAAGTKRTG